MASFGVDSFFYVFWIKIFGIVSVSVGWYLMKKKYLYFFYNLGVGLKKLILIAVMQDAILSLVIFTTVYQFRF